MLSQLPPATIQKALESGVMKQEGALLTPQERTDVANWLSAIKNAPAAIAAASANACPAGQQPSSGSGANRASWGAGPANQRYEPDSG